ncbi:MAG: hypothetical protein KBF28_05840 [Gemmatimonadales bacterium]|nr:hypothetical protein [Gemmatimonadales bacterium]
MISNIATHCDRAVSSCGRQAAAPFGRMPRPDGRGWGRDDLSAARTMARRRPRRGAGRSVRDADDGALTAAAGGGAICVRRAIQCQRAFAGQADIAASRDFPEWVADIGFRKWITQRPVVTSSRS